MLQNVHIEKFGPISPFEMGEGTQTPFGHPLVTGLDIMTHFSFRQLSEVHHAHVF